MEILGIRMKLLPEDNGHSKVAFAELVLGEHQKELLTIKPFVVVRKSDSQYTVQWPRNPDKKYGGFYYYASCPDRGFRAEVEQQVLDKCKALKLVGLLPARTRKKGGV